MSGGRAWVYGDDIDTDCMEAVDPAFAGSVRPGDVFVAGENLGVGSSREQAPQNLQALGIHFVLAKSFGRIFYRNALNLGLPALVCGSTERINKGDELTIDPCPPQP